MPPVAEIITFDHSQASLSDAESVLAPFLQLASGIPGIVAIYHGLEIQTPTKAYIVVLWETYEHHKALIDSPSYHAIRATSPPVVEGSYKMVHGLFKDDAVSTFDAPVVEFAFLALKEGKTVEELGTLLGKLTSQDTETVVSATWGPIMEDEKSAVMIVGWTSMDAHKEAVRNGPEQIGKLIGDILDVATSTITHVEFLKC